MRVSRWDSTNAHTACLRVTQSVLPLHVARLKLLVQFIVIHAATSMASLNRCYSLNDTNSVRNLFLKNIYTPPCFFWKRSHGNSGCDGVCGLERKVMAGDPMQAWGVGTPWGRAHHVYTHRTHARPYREASPVGYVSPLDGLDVVDESEVTSKFTTQLLSADFLDLGVVNLPEHPC